MANPAIEIERLTKDYAVGFWRKKMRRSLDHLTLQVDEGESFGFLGPNGAGKTTTMKLLMGLIFPTSGTARVRGRSMNDVRMHREIGYMPEQPYFYDYLATAADVQLRKFSKGMLQRVGIAQAILHDPQVVFLDEPMSGLDPVGRREVRDIILDLKRQGRTIFFSTHILSDAEMLCDRVAVLVEGKLRGVGSPGEIVSMEVQGMEILFEVGKEQALPANIAARAKNIGNRYRIEVAEEELYAVLEQLRECEGRILSVAPLRPSLEDYFFNLVGRQKTQVPAAEVGVR